MAEPAAPGRAAPRTYGQIAWLWIRVALAVPHVVRPARGRQRADHRPRLRRPVDHVRPPATTWRASRCTRSPCSTAAPRWPSRRRHCHRQRGADRHLHPHRTPRPDDDQAGPAARAGLRRPVHPAPARAAHPGRGGLRVGLLCTSTGPRAGRGRRASMLAQRALVFFGLLRRLLLHPVLDGRTRPSSPTRSPTAGRRSRSTRYHLPARGAASLTFVIPVAFVNWYPCLYLLGRTDPFGIPDGSSSSSPLGRARWSRGGGPAPGAPASATTPPREADDGPD